MKTKEPSRQKTIRHSPSLCVGEQQYVERRKEVILQALNSLQINCTVDSVPHIALVASGGGQRAAVGLTGFLYQLEKEALLDTLLYIGGVSGSTWSMASLYSDPQWSANMDEAVSRLSGPGVELEHALAWLAERSKEEHFSLTDIWGVLTSAGIMKHLDPRPLSAEANRSVTNPYPIYCAIEKHCFSNGPLGGKWFEMSPNEAGFTELNLFVETSLLGSTFQNGELVEKKAEMDMIKLQVPIHDAAEKYLHVYNLLTNLITLTSSIIKDPTALAELGKLQKTLHVSFLTNQALPLVLKWEWGPTSNFLYQFQNASVPDCLQSKERLHLIDAGLLINMAYPSFLGDKRDIDLMIAPEASAGIMFETLTLARDYAAEVKKPFPHIDQNILEERDWPKDCYVFEGTEKEPTIVYMPLFNRKNCKDAEEFKAKMKMFSTFQRPFSQEKIDFLLETAKTNMRNNREILLREINKAALRRMSKMMGQV